MITDNKTKDGPYLSKQYATVENVCVLCVIVRMHDKTILKDNKTKCIIRSSYRPK